MTNEQSHRIYHTEATAYPSTLIRSTKDTAAAKVSLAYVDLPDIQAAHCFLPNADLRGANLESASLYRAFLMKADFRSAVLIGADMTGAILREANFRHADLRKADLRRADLRDADFDGANLHGAVVTGANLSGARLDWKHSTLVLEILRSDPSCRNDTFRMVSELAFETRDHPYGWLASLMSRSKLVAWALPVLYEFIQNNDNSPRILRSLIEDTTRGNSVTRLNRSSSNPPSLYWARSMHNRSTP